MTKHIDLIISSCISNGASEAADLQFTPTDQCVFIATQGHLSFSFKALETLSRKKIHFYDCASSYKHYRALETAGVAFGMSQTNVESKVYLVADLDEVLDKLDVLDDVNYVLAVEVFGSENRKLPKFIYGINKPDAVLTQYAAAQILLAPQSHLVVLGQNYIPDLSNPLMVVGDMLEMYKGWGAEHSSIPSKTHYFNDIKEALQQIYPGIK